MHFCHRQIKKALGITEDVYYPELKKILEENETDEERYDAIRRNVALLIPKHITKGRYFLLPLTTTSIWNMVWEMTTISITWGNRRIRAVGELLQNQYRIGLSRMERVVRERMTTQDIEGISAQSLINIKPVTAAVKEFFGSSPVVTVYGSGTTRFLS